MQMDVQPIATTRAYQQISRQIAAQIRSGHLASGQKLPTERELSRAFSVSGTVIREAIKVLDTMGLVESRQGSGTYVRNDPIPTISEALTLSVRPEKESLARLLRFREELEALAAAWAATHRTEEQRDAILRCATTMTTAAHAEDLAAYDVAHRQFHEVVDDASGNPYLSAVLRAVQHASFTVGPLVPQQDVNFRVAAEYHVRAGAAIASGASDEAAQSLREDVRDVARRYAARAREEE